MSLKRPVLSIGWDKNGESEFAVHLGEVVDLSYERMKELRSMIPVAIYALEEHWRDHGPPSREQAAKQCVAEGLPTSAAE